MKKILFIISSVILLFLFLEITCRAAKFAGIFFFGRNIFPVQIGLDERNLLYEYDKILGWFPKKHSEKYFEGSNRIFVKNNSLGFRDCEHANKKNKPRIMVIGDSFVWGYDVEQNEIFTVKLQNRLKNYDIINCGVSGYSTDQEYIIFKKYVKILNPDIILLIFCGNDRSCNKTNKMTAYYKPYIIEENGGLILKGIPVPKSLNYYYRRFFSKSAFFSFCLNIYHKFMARKITVPDITEKIILEIKKESDSINIPFIVGLANHDAALEEFCAENNINNIVLENNYLYPSFGNHWTPEGHDFVADKIYDFLIAENIAAAN